MGVGDLISDELGPHHSLLRRLFLLFLLFLSLAGLTQDFSPVVYK